MITNPNGSGKRNSRRDLRFSNLRVLFGVGTSSVAAFLAVLAGTTQPASTGDHTGRPDTQMRDSSRTPAGYVGGVRQAWVSNYTGVFDDEPTGITVDGLLNVYVTGYSSIPDYSAYVTIKYNSFGQEAWVASYSGPNSINFAAAIAVDSSGNVYVTGSSGSFGSGDYDYATIKYKNSGQQQWVARYNGPGNLTDYATAIAVDRSGNVYVTGGSGFPSGDYATIKYDNSGQQQWVARYNGPGNADDHAEAIAVDGSGGVYVTGTARAQTLELITPRSSTTIRDSSSGLRDTTARGMALTGLPAWRSMGPEMLMSPARA